MARKKRLAARLGLAGSQNSLPLISSQAMKNLAVTCTLSLENEKNGLEKVWKKSLILSTKKCTNPYLYIYKR